MAKPLTQKNEELKKKMLARVTPEQAAKFEARKRIKSELLDALKEGDLEKVKSLADNDFGIDIKKIWYKKGNYPGVTVDSEAIDLARKWKKQDIVNWLED